jgi:hypothetical protein
MRSVLNSEQFTPFGLWIRQYLRKSGNGLSVTNLDYVFEDFHNKKIMLVEEKQSGGDLHKAQRFTFRAVDQCLRQAAPQSGYEYWGFYIVQLPSGCDMVGPGVRLNGMEVTVEQLVKHLNFETKICDGMKL